jgi:NADH-quinone oxidoreductase subunit N
MMYFYPQSKKQELVLSFTPVVIAIVALAILWGGIGTGLVSFLPGANVIIETAKSSIASLGL